MKKPKVTLTVIKEDTGYSATAAVGNNFIATEGETLEELKAMALEVVNLTFEGKGIVYNEDKIILKPDLASFFEFYKVINAKALSERLA